VDRYLAVRWARRNGRDLDYLDYGRNRATVSKIGREFAPELEIPRFGKPLIRAQSAMLSLGGL
jgi:hypothetical protein